MKSLNIVRDSIDKLYKRKKDTYCVYKKCKNYKLRNKNLCRPHEKKMVNQSTQEYIKILVTTVITTVTTLALLSMYFIYNFDFDFDTGFKYVCENVKKSIEYSTYIFSNVYSNVNNGLHVHCSVLTDVQDEFFVTKNTIYCILTDIQNKLFRYIKY
jgi:hypothetical protein